MKYRITTTENSPFVIVSSNNSFNSNARELVSKYNKELEEVTTELIRNGTLEHLEKYEKDIKKAEYWIKKCRAEITKPLDSTKKELMEVEKVFAPYIAQTKEAIHLLKLEEYKKGESNIIRELEALLREVDVDIDLRVFESFVNEKKKAKTYQTLSKRGELSKSAKAQIKEQFDLVTSPIMEEKRLKEVVDKEYRQFNFNLNNASTEDKLELLRGSICDIYPNIKDSAEMAINGKIEAIRQQAELIKATEQREAEKGIMQKIQQTFASVLNSDDAVEVKESTAEIIELAELIKNADNFNTIKGYLEKANQHLKKITFVAPAPEPAKEAVKEAVKSVWGMTNIDLEIITSFKVYADSENEAIKKMLMNIESHLNIVGLHTVEEIA